MTLQVGVKAFLFNPENKALLLLRSAKSGRTEGTWDLPGGRIEVGASLMENLARELMEETQLMLRSEPVLIAAQDILKFEGLHVVRLTYTARAEGEPVLSDEHTDFRWVSLEEMRQLDRLDTYVKSLLEAGKVVL